MLVCPRAPETVPGRHRDGAPIAMAAYQRAETECSKRTTTTFS